MAVPVFLSLVTPDEARRRLEEHIQPGPREVETCELLEACGRVLAEDVASPCDLPGFARSTVDGFAVRAADTFGASDSMPALLTVSGEVRMGEAACFALGPGECARLATGAMLPSGSDAVVMVETTEDVGSTLIAVSRPVVPGENVVGATEDVARGGVLMRRGCRLRPQDIGMLAAAGVSRVKVATGPRVAIVSTGDELVEVDEVPAPGKVRDANSYSLYAAALAAGARPVSAGVVRDDYHEVISTMREKLAQADMLVVSGGSSIGTQDLAHDAVDSLGAPGVLVHGVAVRPGKPTIIAVADGKPVFGLPGHPVSCLTMFRVFVEPAIARWMGAIPERREVTGRLGANVASVAGREDYVGVRISVRGGVTWADPVFTKSALISGLVESDGFVRIPPEVTGLERGALVTIILF
ncbi:MAG: molybdopterin molybdotransferase MoeA [Firmicutes bacterium]|nr:molybdopterin molybdotransferase MoeA [Bacillota bacterium]MDH7494549.1 molybdopterin molybdotransferase MoeA [Bacillota bacterium]